MNFSYLHNSINFKDFYFYLSFNISKKKGFFVDITYIFFDILMNEFEKTKIKTDIIV